MAIQVITGLENGTQFINKLNTNFQQQGNGAFGGVTNTVHMQLQGGKIATATSSVTTIERNNVVGYPCVSTDDNEFFKNCHTTLLLSLESCSVDSVTTLGGESLKIFCFGADGSYISNVADIASIPSTACYVRFMVTSSSVYTTLRQLSVSVVGKAKFVKNTTPSLVSDSFFSFDTVYPTQFGTTDNENTEGSDVEALGDGYIGDNGRYYDNAWIKLPPNYSAEGPAVPLVVYLHGTNGFDFIKGPDDVGYGPLQSFIANNGYAVCDCSGITNKDKTTLGAGLYDDAFYSPSSVSSVDNMVKYITGNFNVREDGIYIYGKSAGGYVLHLMTEFSSMKIKAAASLAPGISTFSSIQYYLTNELTALKRVFAQLGITDVPNGTWTHDKPIVLANIHKIRQIDCLFMETDLSDSEVSTLVTTILNSGSSTNFSTGKKDFTKSAECMVTLGVSRIHVSVPTKIWVASDDVSVPYNMAELYVEMAQRAGSPVYMRRMPNGTGGHHSVDTDASAPKTNYQTKYAGVVNIPVAYAELVDWFKRW